MHPRQPSGPQLAFAYRQNGREGAGDDSGALAAGIIARHALRIGRLAQATTKHPPNGEALRAVQGRLAPAEPGGPALYN